jgi:ATP-dependent Clp protease ATP-binding subunit ClpC
MVVNPIRRITTDIVGTVVERGALARLRVHVHPIGGDKGFTISHWRDGAALDLANDQASVASEAEVWAYINAHGWSILWDDPTAYTIADRFTARVRTAFAIANDVARNCNNPCIGTEHLLWGLVREGSGVAAIVLNKLGIEPDTFRAAIETHKYPQATTGNGGRLPESSRLKRVVRYAFQEALYMGHGYIGTEHVLLALTRVRRGVAARVLRDAGVRPRDVRRQVAELLQMPSIRRPPSFLELWLFELGYAIGGVIVRTLARTRTARQGTS